MKSTVISSIVALSCFCVNPSVNVRDVALLGACTASLELAVQRRKQLIRTYTNTNFDCYTRVGAEELGNALLKKERRRLALGQLAMITFDVAGMGELNTKIGELAVNDAVKFALSELKSWRGVRFVSQVNSGDEFAIVVDRVDVDGISSRIDQLFQSVGFNGAYVASLSIDPGKSYFDIANQGMTSVYKIKQNK